MDEETVIWRGRPSHVKDLGFHLLCLLFGALVIPLLLSLVRVLETHFTRYEVTTERLRVTRGILSRRMEETELYRIRDTTWDQPFFLRLFGLSNIVLRGTDASSPVETLVAIQKGRELRESLRGAIEKTRAKKGVRTLED